MVTKKTPSTVVRDALGDFALKLVELPDRVLFDNVWARSLRLWGACAGLREKPFK